MKSFIFLPGAFRAVICVVLLSSYQGKAEEVPGGVYSGQDTTGGVVVEIDSITITVREKNGEKRTFVLDDSDRSTPIKVNGRATKFEGIKVGMRAQIKFNTKMDGKRLSKKEDWFPIISVEATTSTHR